MVLMPGMLIDRLCPLRAQSADIYQRCEPSLRVVLSSLPDPQPSAGDGADASDADRSSVPAEGSVS